MDVVSRAANGQSWNSIFPGDAAHIAMKPFPGVFPDRRPAFRGREHHMNQATCVTVRHGFSPFNCTQDWSPGTFSAVPAGLFVAQALPRTSVLGYFQPSLRDWTS